MSKSRFARLADVLILQTVLSVTHTCTTCYIPISPGVIEWSVWSMLASTGVLMGMSVDIMMTNLVSFKSDHKAFFDSDSFRAILI